MMQGEAIGAWPIGDVRSVAADAAADGAWAGPWHAGVRPGLADRIAAAVRMERPERARGRIIR